MFQAGDVHDYSAESMHEKMRVMRADAQPSISIDAKQPVASTPLLEKLGPLSDDDEGPSPEEARNQQEEDLEMLRAENASLRTALSSGQQTIQYLSAACHRAGILVAQPVIPFSVKFPVADEEFNTPRLPGTPQRGDVPSDCGWGKLTLPCTPAPALGSASEAPSGRCGDGDGKRSARLLGDSLRSGRSTAPLDSFDSKASPRSLPNSGATPSPAHVPASISVHVSAHAFAPARVSASSTVSQASVGLYWMATGRRNKMPKHTG